MMNITKILVLLEFIVIRTQTLSEMFLKKEIHLSMGLSCEILPTESMLMPLLMLKMQSKLEKKLYLEW